MARSNFIFRSRDCGGSLCHSVRLVPSTHVASGVYEGSFSDDFADQVDDRPQAHVHTVCRNRSVNAFDNPMICGKRFFFSRGPLLLEEAKTHGPTPVTREGDSFNYS